MKKHADSDAHLSRDGWTDIQTDRQTDRAGWQTDKQVAKLTERHADRHTCRQTDRQVGRRNSPLYRQVRWLRDAQEAKCRGAGHSMKSDSVLASPDSMDSSTRQLPLIKTMSQGALPRSSTSTSPGTRRREDAALLKHTPMGHDLLVPNQGSKHEQHVVCYQTMTHSNLQYNYNNDTCIYIYIYTCIIIVYMYHYQTYCIHIYCGTYTVTTYVHALLMVSAEPLMPLRHPRS